MFGSTVPMRRYREKPITALTHLSAAVDVCIAQGADNVAPVCSIARTTVPVAQFPAPAPQHPHHTPSESRRPPRPPPGPGPARRAIVPVTGIPRRVAYRRARRSSITTTLACRSSANARTSASPRSSPLNSKARLGNAKKAGLIQVACVSACAHAAGSTARNSSCTAWGMSTSPKRSRSSSRRLTDHRAISGVLLTMTGPAGGSAGIGDITL